jgi:antitoxin component YwqK of YwqJK toxin-antitoxin module
MKHRYKYTLIFTMITLISCRTDPKVEIIKVWFDKDSTLLQKEYSVVIIGQDTFLNGMSNEYFRNGRIKQSISYDHGVITGQVNSYFESGSIMTEQSYYQGLLHGVSKDFYLNENIKLKVTYKKGVMDGDIQGLNQKA